MNRTAETVAARGWYYGWTIVAATILSQIAANGLTYNAFSLFMHDWSADLHAPISQLQLALAAMALVTALSAPAIGTLADKYPARRLFAAGLSGIGLFYLAISLVTTVWQVIALYGLLVPVALGLSTSLTGNAVISRWFTHRLGLALGLSSFGLGLAGVLLPPLIAALLPEWGWRAIWRTAGLLIIAVVMPIVVISMRDRPSEGDALSIAPDGDPATASQPQASHATTSQLGWAEVLTRKNFWLLVFIYLPLMAAYGGIAQNIAPIASSRGLEPQAGGQLLSLLSLSQVTANLVLGVLVDRFGYRRPLVGLASVVGVGCVVTAYGQGFAQLALASVLVGTGGAVFTLLAAAMAAEFGPQGVGRAFGMVMFFIPLGALSPFAIAKAQESTGSYVVALLGMLILVGLSGVLAMLLRQPRASGAD